MKTACVQFCPVYGNLSGNTDKLIQDITTIDAELLIFPELSLSGYFFLDTEKISKLAISPKSLEFKEISETAIKTHKIVVFGFAEKDGDKIYNSSALINPFTGDAKIYRKTHLFYREFNVFEKGDTGFFNVHIPEADLNVGMMICYDWRFPESARSLALRGADIVVAPSNLVTDLWHHVMPARAIENKVYLAVANRTGDEELNGEKLNFKGESGIWKYNGHLLAKATPNLDEVIFAEIEPEKTRDKSFNEFNDIFRDRRPDMYL